MKEVQGRAVAGENELHWVLFPSFYVFCKEKLKTGLNAYREQDGESS